MSNPNIPESPFQNIPETKIQMVSCRGVNIENNYFLELFEIILVCEAANLQFTLQLPS